MKINCPVCGGSGKKYKYFEGVMGYVGPNGECWPTEPCNACGGTGLQENGK